MTKKPKKIVIAGAGISGLAAGIWLKEAGCEVEIFEQSERVGGRAITIKRPGNDDIVDVGTQYFHTNYRRIRGLISRVNLERHISKIRGQTWYFDERYKNGGFRVSHRIPYFSSGSLFQNLKMWAVSLFTMIRHPIDPFAVEKDQRADHISAREAFRDDFEWEFTVRGPIAIGALEEPFEHEVSCLQVIRLMRIIGMTDYLSLKGGITTLYERLAEKLDIKLGKRVAGLIIDDAVVRGVTLANGDDIKADHVILATPPEATAEILPACLEDGRSFLKAIRRPPAIIVTLFLDQRLERDVWSYVFRADKGRLVSFCVDTARKNATMCPSGLSGLQAWICSPSAAKMIDQDDDMISRSVIEELARDFPGLERAVENVHVQRFPHTVPQMTVGHNRAAMNFLKLIDGQPGLEVCGDYFSGGYSECAAWSAERAVKQILS